METSDSEECFESADEDFSSDNEEEPSITIKEEIDTTKSKQFNKSSSELNNNPSIITKETEPSNNNKNINKTKIPDNESSIDIKSNKLNQGSSEFGIVPDVMECGVNYDPDELEGSNIANKKSCIYKESTVATKDKKKRSEYAIPPTKVECWEPGMNYKVKEEEEESDSENLGLFIPKTSVEDNASKEKKRTEFAIPPARVECWEPGMNYDVKVKEDTTDNLGLFIHKDSEETVAPKEKKKSLEIDSPLDSNFPIDEVITSELKEKDTCIRSAPLECWEPGYVEVVSVSDVSESLELVETCDLQDEIKKLDSSRETIIKHAVVQDNSAKEIVVKQEMPKKELVLDNKTDSENMWGDDEGWGWDEDKEKPSATKEGEDDLWNNDDWGMNDSKTTDEKNREEPDDLWGDEDDWQIEDKPEKDQSVGDISKVLDNMKVNESTSWGGWGNWGLSSVLSTAANITTSVSQGLTTVIGVPDPEDLARQHLAENEKIKERSPPPQEIQNDESKSFHLGNIVSGVSTITKLVESTGTKVISGGLDTLEILGKKTMQVLSENDPGLKKKRAFLKIDGDKPVLSQMLREAKAKADEENKERERQHFARKANYETIFDDYQGLVHLEALEMLSKQCDIKLENMICKTVDGSLTEMRETMDQVKELCELPEEDEEESFEGDDVEEKLDSAVSDLNVPITYKELLSIWSKTNDWLHSLDDGSNERDIHQHAIETLARLTAVAVEQFHKAGELLLIKEHRSTADEADSLVQLTIILTGLIGLAASKFSEQLNVVASRSGNKEEINSLITNIFFEAANSSRYIQDAFQLLIPVLQVGAI